MAFSNKAMKILALAKERCDDYFDVFSFSCIERVTVFVKNNKLYMFVMYNGLDTEYEWQEPSLSDIDTFCNDDENFADWVKKYI